MVHLYSCFHKFYLHPLGFNASHKSRIKKRKKCGVVENASHKAGGVWLLSGSSKA